MACWVNERMSLLWNLEVPTSCLMAVSQGGPILDPRTPMIADLSCRHPSHLHQCSSELQRPARHWSVVHPCERHELASVSRRFTREGNNQTVNPGGLCACIWAQQAGPSAPSLQGRNSSCIFHQGFLAVSQDTMCPMLVQFSRSTNSMLKKEKWSVSHLLVSDSETPWTVAHQAPLSMGLSRQEYQSGLPFPFFLRGYLKSCYLWAEEPREGDIFTHSFTLFCPVLVSLLCTCITFIFKKQNSIIAG